MPPVPLGWYFSDLISFGEDGGLSVAAIETDMPWKVVI